MKVKGGGVKGEVWWDWKKRGWKLLKRSKTFKKSDHLLGNLDLFIASIYMKSRKILKERMRVVCCLCYGKGEYPEGDWSLLLSSTRILGPDQHPQSFRILHRPAPVSFRCPIDGRYGQRRSCPKASRDWMVSPMPLRWRVWRR